MLVLRRLGYGEHEVTTLTETKNIRSIIRRHSGHLALLVSILGATLLGAMGTANATPKPVSPKTSSAYCDSWIEGSYGKASCWGGLYGGSARIIVICSAWWDPNVTGDWIYVGPGRRIGFADGLGGYCGSSVESVTTETK